MTERILLSPPHMSGNEQKYINHAFETNWIAPLGPNVDAFEKQVAEYVGVKSAAAVSSGTAGIHLALQLLGIKQGDIVFCSSLTFVASANPILYAGATPVFIDSNPETWNMSPNALERALEEAKANNSLPKAIVVVNLYGQSADMDRIMELCDIYNVPMIEDAAESLGAKYNGRRSGSFGKISIFSFNGNKIITTSGGGMIVSDDEELMNKARFLATQARDEAPHYQHSTTGYNYRLSNILAGVGRAQLEVLDERVARRREIFDKYSRSLSHLPGVEFMPEPEGYFSTRWLTTLVINPKEAIADSKTVLDELNKHNIEGRPVWKPLHLQPLFDGVKYYKHSDISVSDFLFENGVCLPSGSSMTEEQQDKVINTLNTVLKNKVC
ncbi:aminotransferase class I/II-fold pyridoxal phosphate-dependent enzyme [Radiobacillus kanasensis]|uniref:DegT/DnrJ/EryC1/StrS family aminotransferase n=1 Tax=Radiobacillus kanasensis TaxID=2844358 RepID=UPI001E53DBC4|nr:aminotransferase class I/II-fold pyridoxal phosphate-dependent enzyme [Radiobacillus kanasensis]UFT98884.1 aminotransferase class I/II-fold pyridoxal phosphate-dependent enzyme [Radiobacillus kanasensis]